MGSEVPMINNVHEAFREAEQFLTGTQKSAQTGSVRLISGVQQNPEAWLVVCSFSTTDGVPAAKFAVIAIDKQSHEIIGYLETGA